jgi:hypothetical protein
VTDDEPSCRLRNLTRRVASLALARFGSAKQDRRGALVTACFAGQLQKNQASQELGGIPETRDMHAAADGGISERSRTGDDRGPHVSGRYGLRFRRVARHESRAGTVLAHELYCRGRGGAVSPRDIRSSAPRDRTTNSLGRQDPEQSGNIPNLQSRLAVSCWTI